MKPCFGGMILATIIIVVSLIWWPAEWAKWTVIGAGALFAVMSLFMGQIYNYSASKDKASKAE